MTARISWGHPRPPRPKPIDVTRVPSMTRQELFDIVTPAVEYYQRSPRWPNLSPKQLAEYQAFMRIFSMYFRPGDVVTAALDLLRDGYDDYWTGLAVPVEASGTENNPTEEKR